MPAGYISSPTGLLVAPVVTKLPQFPCNSFGEPRAGLRAATVADRINERPLIRSQCKLRKSPDIDPGGIVVVCVALSARSLAQTKTGALPERSGGRRRRIQWEGQAPALKFGLELEPKEEATVPSWPLEPPDSPGLKSAARSRVC